MTSPGCQRHIIPAKARELTNVGLMLAQRRRRWTSIKTTLVACLALSGSTLRRLSMDDVTHVNILLDWAQNGLGDGQGHYPECFEMNQGQISTPEH